MKLYRLALLAAALSPAGCAPDAPPPDRIDVAAAADLRHAFDDVVEAFLGAHPSFDVRVVYGSSGNFHAQLARRAPFDLYLSADIDYPRRLIEAGAADANTLFEYAVGRIVLWVPNGSAVDVEALGRDAFLHPSIRRLAIANPAHAPYGRAAEAAMKSLGAHESLRDKLVLGENVAQAAHFVRTGAADAGIVALALALAPRMQAEGRYWEIPPEHFPGMVQGGLIPGHARNPEGAARLVAFLTGESGKAILRRYGFFMPDE